MTQPRSGAGPLAARETRASRSREVMAAPARRPDALVDERRAFLSVFPGVMVAMLLASLDQTILAAAIPAIVGALGGLENASWLAAAYLLAATTAAPVYGHLGDRFGRRRVLLAALAVFTAASVLCTLAQTMTQLVAARALQGLGGGGLMTL